MNVKIKFLLFSVIPLAVAICFFPLWRFKPEGDLLLKTFIALLTMLMNFIITSVFLLFLTFKFGIAYKVSLLLCIPICFLVDAAASLIQYCNWGISTGLLKSPDFETVFIIQSELFISMNILVIGFIIISIVKLITK